jgi:hypothetical protein
VGQPSRVLGHDSLSSQTWMSVHFLESAPQESAPTPWVPFPVRIVMRATSPVPWATPVKVRAFSGESTNGMQANNPLLTRRKEQGSRCLPRMVSWLGIPSPTPSQTGIRKATETCGWGEQGMSSQAAVCVSSTEGHCSTCSFLGIVLDSLWTWEGPQNLF